MIKVLKAVCEVLGLIFFIGLILTMFLYSGNTMSLTTAIFYIAITGLLTFGCMVGHWILTEKEQNTDGLDYLKDISRRC